MNTLFLEQNTIASKTLECVPNIKFMTSKTLIRNMCNQLNLNVLDYEKLIVSLLVIYIYQIKSLVYSYIVRVVLTRHCGILDARC